MKVRSDCLISGAIAAIVGIGALGGVATLPERGAPYMHTAPITTKVGLKPLVTDELRDLQKELHGAERARISGQ